MNELGLAVDGLTRVGEPIPGIVTAKVLETRAHPQAERVHEVFVDTGDGQPLHVWCGAFNMQAGDVVPLATIGTTMPERPADRPPQDPGRRQRGDAVLGRGARSRRRPLRHPDPAARDRARRAGRAGPRRQRRRRLRPRRHPQPARRLRPPRCGPGRRRAPGGAASTRRRRSWWPTGRSGRRRWRSSRPTSAAASSRSSSRASASVRPRPGWPSGSPGPGCGRSATSSTSRTT